MPIKVKVPPAKARTRRTVPGQSARSAIQPQTMPPGGTGLALPGMPNATLQTLPMAAPPQAGQPINPEQLRDLLKEVSVNRRRFLGLQPERLYNPDELVGRRGLSTYGKMMADDQVRAALTLKKHAVLSTGWDVEPASDSELDVEVAEFVKYNFEAMDGTLDDNLLGILSSLAYGFSLTELTFRPIIDGQFAGKLGYRALKTRLPHDFLFIVDQHDNLLADGIEQFGVRLPVWKFCIHSANKEFDNWYGTSDLRAAYRSYWFKDNILKWWGMFLDRYSIPLAAATVPRASALPDGAITDFRVLLDNLQASTSIVYPSDFTLSFPTANIGAASSQVFEQALQAADMGIAKALLMPNLMGVSPSGHTGSYSQARKQFDVFILIVEKLQRELSETVMGEQIIKRLVDLNYQVEDYPSFLFLPFTETNKAELLVLWGQMMAAGVVQSRPEDEAHARMALEFPEVPLEELRAQADAQAAQAAAIAAGGQPGDGQTLGGETPGGVATGDGAPGEPGPSGELSDEAINKIIDEVLGSAPRKPGSTSTGGGRSAPAGGGAGHPLVDQAMGALQAKQGGSASVAGYAEPAAGRLGGTVAADQEDVPDFTDEEEIRKRLSDALLLAEREHPDWSEAELVAAAVDQVERSMLGQLGPSGIAIASPEEVAAGQQLDALIDQVLGEAGKAGDAAPVGGSQGADKASLPDAHAGGPTDIELDRLIAGVTAGALPDDTEASLAAAVTTIVREHPDWSEQSLRDEIRRRLEGLGITAEKVGEANAPGGGAASGRIGAAGGRPSAMGEET